MNRLQKSGACLAGVTNRPKNETGTMDVDEVSRYFMRLFSKIKRSIVDVTEMICGIMD